MPDVKEVYEVVTQQTPPQPDALERQRKRQMRHTMNQRLSAFALAAVIAGLAIVAVRATAGDDGLRVATPNGIGPSLTAPGVPKVDYVLDLNTRAMTPLPDAILRSLGKRDESGQYAASADGTQLAYVGTGDLQGTPEIFIARIDGTGVRQVTEGPGIQWLASPAWSPDGTRIAYEADLTQPGPLAAPGHHLFVLDVATGESTQITFEPNNVRSPQFTPDGSSILYTGGTDLRPVVRTVPVAGGKSTLLIGPREGLDDAGNASLSPDGSLVTYLASGFPTSGEGHCGPCRFVANADGTDRRVIPGFQSNPAGTWSPDGTRIVDLSCRGVESEENCSAPLAITVVDIATGKATRVALGSGAIWLDDHTLLVEV